MDPIVTSRIQRVRREPKRRELEVLRVERLSPGFVSVTFGGEALSDFRSDAFDDHVKFIFEDAAGQAQRRDFTPRRFDAAGRQLTIEFDTHGEGPASRWAMTAAPGQRAVVGGPRGSLIVPMDYDWHLLAGDACALPAIHRRLEELPQDVRVIVVAQVHEEDRRQFATRAKLDLRWVDTADELVAAVQSLQLPAGEGFAWGAGEARSMARLRDLLLEEKHHPKEAMRIAAYWKQGSAEHHEELTRA